MSEKDLENEVKEFSIDDTEKAVEELKEDDKPLDFKSLRERLRGIMR